jgi:FAD/FMN-containing dehydrogenase
MSTKYGKIEDMVSALTWVTGRGERMDLDSASGGIDWVQLVVGSEGRLGLISEATLSVQAIPHKRLLRGYWFPDVAAGCAAIQQILQRGLRPAVVRLYDELDTLLAGTGRHPPSLNQPLLSNLSGTAGRLLGQLSGLLGKFEVGRSRQQLELSDLLQLLKPDAERAKHRLERWLVQTALLKTEPVGQLLDSLSVETPHRLSADHRLRGRTDHHRDGRTARSR